jgi:hypothetical protein
MRAAIASLALIAAASVAWTAAPAQSGSGAERIRRVIVYGNDPCPRGTGEIVICGRRPDRDRYRVPEEFRDAPGTDPDSTSWAVRAETMEFVGNTGIQSCSTVGPAGSTGCWQQLMRAARREQRAIQRTSSGTEHDVVEAAEMERALHSLQDMKRRLWSRQPGRCNDPRCRWLIGRRRAR